MLSVSISFSKPEEMTFHLKEHQLICCTYYKSIYSSFYLFIKMLKLIKVFISGVISLYLNDFFIHIYRYHEILLATRELQNPSKNSRVINSKDEVKAINCFPNINTKKKEIIGDV